MEEVFLPVFGGDEAEAALGDDLLDGTGGHIIDPFFSSRTRWQTHGLFGKGGSTTRSVAARYSNTLRVLAMGR